jgi:hypothetical protein
MKAKKTTTKTAATKKATAATKKTSRPVVSAETALATVKATKNTKGAKPATTPKADGPRPASKQSTLIEMLKRPTGANLAEVMKRFSWQSHTVRALMSQGGSLARKHGLTVVSEKVGDQRVYKIK